MVGTVIEILLVEDNLGDVELTREMLKLGKVAVNLHVATDGVAAMTYLLQEGEYAGVVRPDLILLDLNLPKKDGREVLRDIKSDDTLQCIPVVVLTTSGAEEDVLKSYELGASCYVTKPVSLSEFAKVVQALNDFWFTVVKLPPRSAS